MRPRLVKRGALAMAAIGIAGLLLTGFPRSRATADERQFFAVAAADGVRVGEFAKNAPVADQVLDFGIPSAQASLDPLASTGYAAYPYPGDTALAGPGLGRGALQGSPFNLPPSVTNNIPDYGLIAASNYPAKPEASVGQDPFALKAQSSENSSQSSATSGIASGDQAHFGYLAATATSTHDPSGGEAKAVGESTVESIDIQGVLRIGRVHARASATGPADGPAAIASEFQAEGVTIAGQAVALTDKGFPDTSPLTQALKQAGITVLPVAKTQDADGVVSAGLIIQVPHTFPGSPQPSVGGETVSASPETSESAAPVSAPSSADLSASAPSSATPAPSTAGTTRGATPSSNGQLVPVSASGTTLSATTLFYLVLALGGLSAFAGVQLIRFFAVRLAWNS